MQERRKPYVLKIVLVISVTNQICRIILITSKLITISFGNSSSKIEILTVLYLIKVTVTSDNRDVLQG